MRPWARLRATGDDRGRMGVMSLHGNLLGPEPTLLPGRPGRGRARPGHRPAEVAAAHPTSSIAWAVLAEQALADGLTITGYAYARTGYHRGLDQLRRIGLEGLRAGAVVARAQPRLPARARRAAPGRRRRSARPTRPSAAAIFLADSDPAAAAALGLD